LDTDKKAGDETLRGVEDPFLLDCGVCMKTMKAGKKEINF
jgi:hypothetical protein